MGSVLVVKTINKTKLFLSLLLVGGLAIVLTSKIGTLMVCRSNNKLIDWVQAELITDLSITSNEWRCVGYNVKYRREPDFLFMSTAGKINEFRFTPIKAESQHHRETYRYISEIVSSLSFVEDPLTIDDISTNINLYTYVGAGYTAILAKKGPEQFLFYLGGQ